MFVKIKTLLFSLLVSLTVVIASLGCSIFSDCKVESIALSIDNYLNKNGLKYVYSEVKSNSSNPQEDYFDTKAVHYLNFAFFWDFSSGPQNKTFRKFSISNGFAPITITTGDAFINPSIISSPNAKEIKGDYYGFKLLFGHDWKDVDSHECFYITESIANSISSITGLSFSELIDREFECACTNTKLVSAVYKKKISGIISNESLGDLKDIVGDDFIYIQASSNYYLREFCNQTICTLFKNNIVANRTCLRYYLNFESYKESYIVFYNFDKASGRFLTDSLQEEFVLSFNHYSSAKSFALPIIMVVDIALYCFVIFIYKRKTLKNKIINKIGFNSSALLPVLLTIFLLFIFKKIKINGFYLPLMTIDFLIIVCILIVLGLIVGMLASKLLNNNSIEGAFIEVNI